MEDKNHLVTDEWVEIQLPYMVSTEEPVRTRGWGGEISLPAGGDDSLSFLLCLLEHHSGGGVGVPLQPGQLKVEAPHWAFVDVGVVHEPFIRILYSDSPPIPTSGKHESPVCSYTFA